MQKVINFEIALKKAMSMRTDGDRLKSIEEIYKDINEAFEILNSMELDDKDYAMSAKPLRNLQNTFDFALEEGLKKGREKAKAIEIAKTLLSLGDNSDKISKVTELSIKEIEELKRRKMERK